MRGPEVLKMFKTLNLLTLFFIFNPSDEDEFKPNPMPTIHSDDLGGRTFLLPTEEHGEDFPAKVIKKIAKLTMLEPHSV